MTKELLKLRVEQEIDKAYPELLKLADTLQKIPELGYREFATGKVMKEIFQDNGLQDISTVAYTGVKGLLSSGRPGPTLAVIGELDSIICRQHPQANEATGAAHACGHFVQLVTMVGLIKALTKVMDDEELVGNILFVAIPAEEHIELEYRRSLVEKGIIRYMSGKQQGLYEGHFDHVDLAIMTHVLPISYPHAVYAGMTSNAIITKRITFQGKEAHAAAAAHEGINALHMAMLAINNINALRETFQETDRVRIHSKVVEGGEAVNVIPGRVVMETIVRAASLDAVERVSNTVDRCFKAGALAIGGHVRIENAQGYLPMRNDTKMMNYFVDNIKKYLDDERIGYLRDIAASFDFGDLTHLIPGLHTFVCSSKGSLHSEEFAIVDEELTYGINVKALAATILDLLAEGGKKSVEITEAYSAIFDKESYFSYLKKQSKTILYGGE